MKLHFPLCDFFITNSIRYNLRRIHFHSYHYILNQFYGCNSSKIPCTPSVVYDKNSMRHLVSNIWWSRGRHSTSVRLFRERVYHSLHNRIRCPLNDRPECFVANLNGRYPQRKERRRALRGACKIKVLCSTTLQYHRFVCNSSILHRTTQPQPPNFWIGNLAKKMMCVEVF